MLYRFSIQKQLLFLPILLIAVSAIADDEVSTAKSQLTRQIELIDQLQPYAERIDQGRLFFLRKASEKVLAHIEQHGLAHMASFRSYQELIIAYRYSVAFFKQIETKKTTESIVEILKISDEIAKARGFDDVPYTKVTASVFTQMHQLVLHLIDRPNLPEDLRARLHDLKPSLGQVIAIAEQGDRPKAFEAATALYHQIAALYPQFNQISASDAAFETILEVQGLNEFYGEYAQIDQAPALQEEEKK